MLRSSHLALVGLLAGFHAPALAETFVLANGGQIEGEWLNPKESPRESYQVRTTAGAQLTLDKAQVERVLSKSVAEKQYEEHLSRMPPTADGNWKLAEWCGKQALKSQRQFHLEQAIKLDPDHAAARQALGFSKVNNVWRRTEDFWRNQGYVQHRGQWRLPQEIAIEEAAEKRDQELRDWKRKLKMWRGWIVKGSEREGDGMRQIRQVREPLATSALIDMLAEETEPRLKTLFLDALAAMQSPAAIPLLVRRSIDDPHEATRDRCLDEVTKWGGAAAAAAYTGYLKSSDNNVVNRAAVALGRIGDLETTKELIEALTTKHRFIINPNAGNMNVGFSPNGGVNGMTMGGGPKRVEQELQNNAVLAALNVMHPGQPFGYDKTQWRNWLADKAQPRKFSLRRDE